jgi:hypothetical protein
MTQHLTTQDVTMTSSADSAINTADPDSSPADTGSNNGNHPSARTTTPAPRFAHPTEPQTNPSAAQAPNPSATPTQATATPHVSTRNLAIRRGLQELTRERLDAEAAEQAAAQANAPASTTNTGATAAAATPNIELTPTTANGWPICHGEHPLWFLVNGKQEQIFKALNVSDNNVVIHVANEISHDRNRSPVVANGV